MVADPVSVAPNHNTSRANCVLGTTDVVLSGVPHQDTWAAVAQKNRRNRHNRWSLFLRTMSPPKTKLFSNLRSSFTVEIIAPGRVGSWRLVCCYDAMYLTQIS